MCSAVCCSAHARGNLGRLDGNGADLLSNVPEAIFSGVFVTFGCGGVTETDDRVKILLGKAIDQGSKQAEVIVVPWYLPILLRE